MSGYKNILLDWDGNLAKTLDIWLIVNRASLERRGINVSDQEIAIRCLGRPIEGFTELGVVGIGAAINEMDAMAKKLLPEAELYPDALFVLEVLKNKGKRTALITTSLRSNVVHALDKYKINHFFDAIITHEDTEQHKPHPESLELALTKLGGNKKSTVMIGDSDKDIGAANNAGIDSILFYPELHKKFYDLDELKALKPTHIINDFRQIIDIV